MHANLTTYRAWALGVTVMVCLLLQGAAAAEFKKGMTAYNSGDYETALALWQPLAENGDANAQHGMGLLYGNGFGVPLDDDLALKWHRLAADQGHGGSQCNLAVMYANGWGVPQDDAEALRWYNLAAENGVAEAQSALANLYYSGFGVPSSKVEAYKWFSIAAENGDTDSGYKRDEIGESLTPDELAEANGRATAWLSERKTSDDGP